MMEEMLLTLVMMVMVHACSKPLLSVIYVTSRPSLHCTCDVIVGTGRSEEEDRFDTTGLDAGVQ